MCFFSKTEYAEVFLPLSLDDTTEDRAAGTISIEASGAFMGARRYCYATYSINTKYLDETDEMYGLLMNSPEITVKVIFKIRKGKVKDFKIDLNSLAEACRDDRFRSLGLLCWGLNDKSYSEFDKK